MSRERVGTVEGRGAGWRGKVGLAQATYRGRTLAYWYDTAPVGVEILPGMIGYRKGERADFATGLARMDDVLDELAGMGCDAVVATGTPPFLLEGPEAEESWRLRAEARLKIPVVMPMQPHAQALQALGVTRVAVATYYRGELNDKLVAYLAAYGIEAVLLDKLRLPGSSGDEGLYAVSMRDLDGVSFQDVYTHCKRGVITRAGSVDALYINGGGWDAGPAVAYLERDLDIPVVWASSAAVWAVYRRLRIRSDAQGCRLLREWPPLRSMPGTSVLAAPEVVNAPNCELS